MPTCPYCQTELRFGSMRVRAQVPDAARELKLTDAEYAWFCPKCHSRSEAVRVSRCEHCGERIAFSSGQPPPGFQSADLAAQRERGSDVCLGCAGMTQGGHAHDQPICSKCGERPAAKFTALDSYCLPCWYSR